MKTLYIFKPSENWSCCGGGLVIIADSFDEAQSLFPEEKLFMTEEDAEKHQKNFDMWTLVESFPVQSEKSRIVLYNCNWA